MNHYLSGIYEYSFNNHNRKYIGSSINLSKREYNHLSLLKNGNHQNSSFQDLYNREGIKNLKYHVIEYIDNTKYLNKQISYSDFRNYIFEIEQGYLDKYYAQEYVKDRTDRRFFELLLNKSVLAKYPESIETFSKQKVVYQYDLEGNFIDEYFNSIIAEACLKIDSSSIRRASEGRRLSAGGFKWSYEKLDELERYKISSQKEIFQYDKNNNFIKRYDSIKQARVETGIDIRKESNFKSKSQGGYIWLLKDEKFPIRKHRKNFTKSEINTIKEDFKLRVSKYGDSIKFVKEYAEKFESTTSSIQSIIYNR